MTGPKGIKWSAPVLIRKVGAELEVTVPSRVCEALALGAGDVLNFTQLPDGAIEVWPVRKSGYTSLDDFERKPAKGGSGAGAKAKAKAKGKKK